MIARFHYDRSQLQAFLDQDPSADPAEIQSHIESCADCQAELETIAQADFDWEQATRLLRVDPTSLTNSFDQPMELDDIPGFLEPSDHPGSLGRFARYEVLEILGRGGMGIVMRGYDTSLNRHSAVKVLAPELATSAAARMRFSREAKSAAAVVHPHVVPIQTVDEHNGIPYLVMPVVEGNSVDARVRSVGPLTVIETVRIASQVAEGLAAAHEQGLVHRDIKPANVLLENGVERVQITDFGLARAVDDASMTRSGVIAGTPQYMSPEQAHGDSIDHRSDLFSLGSLIYFMLTGRSPFRSETTMGVLNRIVNDQPRRLRSINADVPEWLEQIVTKLLAKSPDERFQNALQVAEVLQQWHAHLQTPDAVPEPTTTDLPGLPAPVSDGGNRWPPRNRLVAAAAAAFFAIFGTIIYLETSKGTLRIESNSNAQVPIVIRQDGNVVQEFTVTQDGTTTRLRAGKYSIESKADDQSITLQNNQVTIQSGGRWVARIAMQEPPESVFESRDPSIIRQAAAEDTRDGNYEASLDKILWCWENGVEANSAWYAVRRSFLLSDWLDLADSYPTALQKLKSIQDELQQQITAKDQHRVSEDDFADFASINRVLREEQRTIEVYDQLDPRDQARVKYYLPKPLSSDGSDGAEQIAGADQDDQPRQPVEAKPLDRLRDWIETLPGGFNDPPKISPFTRMQFDDERVIVTMDSKTYELLGIDHFLIQELIQKTRDHYDQKWKKRLSEDLVEVLWHLGHIPGQNVELRLKPIDSDQEITIPHAPMTKKNRSELYRDNDHNQP
ncbi:Serine/threonine-protein kinase PknB [Rubripirellula lacrimiformis]|uniref:non-specific serine/threonine protein kinase n=1 Tax=Rubripirellula lacrimiformis TaxID=1930273 RepID=A0A517NEX2_9BACT|nr:serine/threonine-protein kinase [Rubripirellula lacrimiformis]QDT05598.1 Serine/threonine-protein kinase PknB [Rubripirellula lacrimiformis]